MRHHKVLAWERRLKRLFDKVDDLLEDEFGGRFLLHPARPERGATANKESDGLFNIGASFSAGFGSRLGKGYIIDVRMVTLDNVPEEIRNDIHNAVIREVEYLLPRYFPGKHLTVKKDGSVFKITGDLGLGSL
ncbi:MAG: hypothetical protein E4H36_10120 [Spirochaetales bacterium]|nr:MAG: hypothetical protein E4H36_10120 [Spirochaetales bacterium]